MRHPVQPIRLVTGAWDTLDEPVHVRVFDATAVAIL
jgi:hypothetical protein